jgi:PadR family transcriptional regulator, regulatory protein PadR
MGSSVVPRNHFRASPADRGFVYRTLRAMEAEGLVASAWDPSPSGPARRTYTVTPAGRNWAAAASAGLGEADRHMARWLARYRMLVRRGGSQPAPDVSAASGAG